VNINEGIILRVSNDILSELHVDTQNNYLEDTNGSRPDQ
jgi:propanediol utilization protein